MTSYYTQIPTLAMRARAATLVVVGRVGKALRADAEVHDGKTWLRTTYQVHVEQVLKADAKANLSGQVLAVQVLHGEATHDAAPKAWVAPEGAQVLLMLSEGMVHGTYVPYLGSAFALGADGHLQLGDHAAEKLGLLGAAKAGEGGIGLPAVQALVNDVLREDAEALQHKPSVAPPVTEMPGADLLAGHDSGGRNAAPLPRAEHANGGGPGGAA